MNIYVCGNPLVKEDSLPLRILPVLQKKFPEINFVEFEPTEDLPKEDNLVIIDTVINAKDVMLIDDIDKFVQTKALSLHDFDLGLNLKLAKKLGKIKSVKIIGVPPNGSVDKVCSVISGL
jgi:Ni,Fe-hydrogenase maturation factor